MKKRFIIIMLCLIMMLSSISVSNAHEKQSEHDADLRNVLFGRNKSPADNEKFQFIADAAALCIDQYSSNDTIRAKEDTFDQLKKRVGFSYTFDDIELKKGRAGAITNVTGTTHRRYTHKGWNFEYGGDGADFWELRKKILIVTVNKELFDTSPGIFARLPYVGKYLDNDEPCSEQCEAFCELIYYVHILGDYEKGKNKSSVQNLVTTPLYPNNGSPGLIQDLRTLIPILFGSQQQWNYSLLNNKLKAVEEKARLLYKDNGINTQEKADLCCDYAQEVLNLLIDYIPGLLQKTEFFQAAFPAKNAA